MRAAGRATCGDTVKCNCKQLQRAYDSLEGATRNPAPSPWPSHQHPHQTLLSKPWPPPASHPEPQAQALPLPHVQV